jgi:hypothetical protein
LDTAELNFSAAPQYGPILRADIRYNDWVRFCRGRRVLQVVVKTVSKSPAGIYRADYRDPFPAPAYLWPVPIPEIFDGEQLSVDGAELE